MALKKCIIGRVAAKVALTDSGCLEWIAYIESNGYARIWLDGKNVQAHRWSYEHHIGPIPEGLVIDHLCRNKACIHPDHLEAVTTSENVLRGVLADVVRERWHGMTHCPKGHLYDEANTRLTATGRACIACKKQSNKDWYARNRELTIQRAAEWRLSHLERSREVSRESQRRYRDKKKEVA